MIRKKYSDFLRYHNKKELINFYSNILESNRYAWDSQGNEIPVSEFDDSLEEYKKRLLKYPDNEKVGVFYELAKKIKENDTYKKNKSFIKLLALFAPIISLSTLVDYLDDKDPVMHAQVSSIIQDTPELKDTINLEEVDKVEIDKIDNKDSKNNKEIITSTPVSFDKAQEYVKSIEGGYSSDKNDKGNYYINSENKKIFIGSKYGISARVLSKYLNRDITPKDMVDLEYNDALNIYEDKYWNRNNLDLLTNQSVANILYDGCVNQGNTTMKRIIRDILKSKKYDITLSEAFSPSTIAVLNRLKQEELFNSIKTARLAKYKKTIGWKRYGKGWSNRLDRITFES